MKNEIKIESVKRETRKALLVVIEGNEFWIQKRWLRADNTLTPAGVKNYEAEMERNASAGVASSAERYEAEQNEVLYFEVAYETAKAVMFKQILNDSQYHHALEIEIERLVHQVKWVPKSCLEADGGIKRKNWKKFEWKFDKYEYFNEKDKFLFDFN